METATPIIAMKGIALSKDPIITFAVDFSAVGGVVTAIVSNELEVIWTLMVCEADEVETV